uniref:DNA/RNA non-specific endonuclease n=1 Tax=Agathobacter sp. TaxID=2021311 RepID=UPI00405722C6
MKKGKSIILSIMATVIVIIGGWLGISEANPTGVTVDEVSLESIPEYTDEPYVVINDNMPFFTEEDYTETSFETYSELDALGRCGAAYANVGVDIMPTEDREDIGHVKPSGWQTAKYDVVEGKYLYNRCHLIGFQLTGENANKQNLITGTRYFNVQGMLPFENMVADYVKETENHVLFRVTPIYKGDNPVASGVQMEAWSVEDSGEGVCFNVFVYNIQPGVTIDYATGKSALAEAEEGQEEAVYILNTSGKKFHYADCSGVSGMKAENKEEYTGSRKNLVLQGYEPCGKCNP